MFEIIEKIQNCIGKDILDNEIEHLYWLGRFLQENFKEFNKEINDIKTIYSISLKPTKSIKNRCHYGYIRRLYNVIEAFYILKQHTEDIIKKYQSDKLFNDECSCKKTEFNIKNLQAVFLRRLRACIVHYKIPKTIIRLKLLQGQAPEVRIYLSKKSLLKWDKWDENILAYVNKFSENIDIDSIIVCCINDLIHFVNWLINKIVEMNRLELEEYNKLIKQWNNFDIVKESANV